MTMVYEDHEGEAGTDIPMRRIRFTVNGQKKIAEVEPRLLLAHLIRRGLGLTGTHMGCEGWPPRVSCTHCRRASRRSTACSAGSALPG
jgi:hypothetical protein